MHAASLPLLVAALLFSTGGAAIKLCGMPAWQVAGLRSGIAAIVIFALLPQSRRAWTRRTFAVACTYALTLTLYAVANRLTTAANTIFLQSTAPLYVLLLSPVLLRERIRKLDVAVLCVLALGMVLFLIGSEPASAIATEPELGDLLAAGAGFTWALTILGMRGLARSGEDGSGGAAAAAAGLGSVLSCLFCLPMALPLVSSGAGDWLVVGYLGVFQVGIAYCCLVRGMARVPATAAALILMVEPVFNPLWAYLVHAEAPGSLSLAGACVVVLGLLLRTLGGAKSRVQAQQVQS